MKKLLLAGILMIALYANSCTEAQDTKTKLTVTEFAQKIKETPSPVVIDVRTPNEYSKGHVANALNYDWNGDAFENQIASIDKTKPIFVYCLSGGRSSAAAEKMRSEGFKQVYEMQGGMMQWRSANLPEVTVDKPASPGMTRQQFEDQLSNSKMVLVDFYADWCIPCKKMKSYLDSISANMPDKLVVLRINADDNTVLCKEMHIDSLPVIQLYKNKSLRWKHSGFIAKSDVLKQLN